MRVIIEVDDVQELRGVLRALVDDRDSPAPVDDKPNRSRVAKEKPAPVEEKPAPVEEKPVDLIAVRALLAQLNSQGKKEQVKQLLKDAGYEKLTDIPQSELPGLYEEAKKL
jgi:hypothetical protein